MTTEEMTEIPEQHKAACALLEGQGWRKVGHRSAFDGTRMLRETVLQQHNREGYGSCMTIYTVTK